ncbi:hypothetical protein ACVXHB_22090 [Escherichia coli]
MSQAALNTRNSEEEVSSRRNNGTRLAGILFLLTVLTTVLVSGWVVLGWMEDAQRLPLSKLVLTVNAITRVMTISGSQSCIG